MNVRGFGFDDAPRPDGTTRLETEADARAVMRAEPDAQEKEPQDDEPTDEPGYGHGV